MPLQSQTPSSGEDVPVMGARPQYCTESQTPGFSLEIRSILQLTESWDLEFNTGKGIGPVGKKVDALSGSWVSSSNFAVD